MIAAAALVGPSVPQASESAPLHLELRVFDGPAEVTGQTRITLHRAGERDAPLAQLAGSVPLRLDVPEGIYDVQAIQERDGEVVNIRWANRLVVMPYPDEKGRHLEVVNFRAGYGALQVRAVDGTRPDCALYPAGQRTKRVAEPIAGDGYILFVVPAGVYDLEVRGDAKPARHNNIEVPLDRTRLWLLQ